MTSRSDSTKPPEKPEEGFVDDPAAENEPDKYRRHMWAETHVHRVSSSDIPHSDKIEPYHIKEKKKGR